MQVVKIKRLPRRANIEETMRKASEETVSVLICMIGAVKGYTLTMGSKKIGALNDPGIF